MRHHIIVKWKKEIEKPDTAAIGRLFEKALAIEGVHSVSLHPNVIDRANRFDLLILLCMEREALPLFDASEVHYVWKETYSNQMEAKTIFDCE